MEIILWIICLLFSICLVVSPFVCLYWVFRPPEWFWWKHKLISNIIGIVAFCSCVFIIGIGVSSLLWFIPDTLLWDVSADSDSGPAPVRYFVASLIGFCGTLALSFKLEEACQEKRRRDREERISYKKHIFRRMSEAELGRKKEELDKLWKNGELGPFHEEVLTALEQVLEEQDKQEDSMS